MPEKSGPAARCGGSYPLVNGRFARRSLSCSSGIASEGTLARRSTFRARDEVVLDHDMTGDALAPLAWQVDGWRYCHLQAAVRESSSHHRRRLCANRTETACALFANLEAHDFGVRKIGLSVMRRPIADYDVYVPIACRAEYLVRFHEYTSAACFGRSLRSSMTALARPLLPGSTWRGCGGPGPRPSRITPSSRYRHACSFRRGS